MLVRQHFRVGWLLAFKVFHVGAHEGRAGMLPSLWVHRCSARLRHRILALAFRLLSKVGWQAGMLSQVMCRQACEPPPC